MNRKQKWYYKNRDRILAQKKEYYNRTKEKRAEYDRTRYQQIKEQKKEYNKDYRRQNLEMWRFLLKELGFAKCSRCGYDESIVAIDAHHVDAADFSIGRFLSQAFSEKNIDKLVEELIKCVPLCANCHRIVHLDGGSI